MESDRLAELLSRKLSGEATAEELEELAAYLEKNQGDQYFTELLTSYWNSAGAEPSTIDKNPDEHFNHILQMADKPAPEEEVVQMETIPHPRRRTLWIKWVAAAMLIITPGLVWWFINHKEEKPIQANLPVNKEAIVSKGTRTRMILSDGTLVLLNSESKLKYAGNFSDSLREVYLEGEAFFDVVKDAKRPFIVHTSGIDIKVLGTAFNVKAYSGESTVEAILIRGLIEVIDPKNPAHPGILLKPHEKLVFDRDKNTVASVKENKNSVPSISKDLSSPAISITPLPKNIADTAIIETSWVYNKLVFEGDTFLELAVKLERWFNVKIKFNHEKIAMLRLRGSFENETIEQVLQALQVVASFSYKINGDQVMIDK